MSFLSATWKELIGLFVDDGNLAAQILIMVLAVGGLVKYAGFPPLAGGGILIFGCLLILAASLRRKLRS